MEHETVKGNIEVILIGTTITIKVEIDQERGHSQDVIVVTELEVQAIVGLGQDPEPALIWTE